MRPYVSLMTAAALLLHLVLGCCAHHSHAAEQRQTTNNGQAVPIHTSGCSHAHAPSHREHESEPHGSPVPADTPHEPCHEGSCAFLHTAPSALEQDSLPTLLYVEMPRRMIHLELSSCCLQLQFSTPPPPPVRLSVLYRQLLI